MSDRFGEYELVRYLTAGGMADLYLARSPRSTDDLVLKRIQQRYLDHSMVVKLFIDEGRIAQTLQHPNIVRVVDVGNENGIYYIAMEYIPGHDLIAVARRGVETGHFLPRPIAVGIIAQVATGLAYAHTRTDGVGRPLSIVHCDISPGNVVVSSRGTAKIVDFGIARATIALRKEDGVAGKYNYMAPEQIRGEPVDARADLFSLGVILYELTLGKRLFKGRPEVVRRKVLEGRIPRPRELLAAYPEALERILSRLLARDPETRYPSAAALRSDLRAYLQNEETGWSKVDVARYLRDLFRAPRGLTDDPEFEPASGDEELELERGMPLIAEIDDEIEADAEDAEEESFSFSDAFAVEERTERAADGAPDRSRTSPDLPLPARAPEGRDTTQTAPDLDDMTPPPLDFEGPEVAPPEDEMVVEELTSAELSTVDEPPPPAAGPVATHAPPPPVDKTVSTPNPLFTEPARERLPDPPLSPLVPDPPPPVEPPPPQMPIEVMATKLPRLSDEDTGPIRLKPRAGEMHVTPRPETPSRSVQVTLAPPPAAAPPTVKKPPARRPVVAADPATALVRLPEARTMPRSRDHDGTELVQNPPPRRRRRRVSTAVVLGGCMMVAAGVLLALFFVLR